MAQPTTPPFKAIECRFAFYQKSNQTDNDIHFVKEQIHNLDGTITPSTRMIKNYKREFYITKKAYQNHNDKKEWEDITKLDVFKCTQTDLQRSVAAALGKPWLKGGIRDLQESPYLYGTDISSSALLKKDYKDKWKDVHTPYSVAGFDSETDVLYDTGQIKILSITFKDRVFTAIDEAFVKGYSNVLERLQELAIKYMGDVIKDRNIKIEIKLCNTEIDIVKSVITKAHEWKPDFLTVWNIEFDMNKVIAACERAGVTPESILCDPSVPQEYRSFKFKAGPAKKITASGKVMSYKPAQRWHTVFCPASFYWIDGMCSYKHVRAGAPEETSYSLNAILDKTFEGKVQKLKFKEADEYTGLAWHQFMQKNYPLEYVVYNQFDCICMEMQDEKIYDLQLSIPMFSGFSDFTNFNSQPKRAADDMHFFVKDNKQKIIGSTSYDMTEDFDDETTGLSDWIVMLQANLDFENGLKIIVENTELQTNLRAHCADIDIVGAYPSNTIVANVSKETTRKELINIEGIDEETQRKQTINLSGGRVNAVEICSTLFGLPTLDVMLEAFKADINQ
jgi:hypothetical protein